MSGSLVLDNDGAVCGVVKTAADTRLSDGGWIVPGDVVASHFPEMMATNTEHHRPGSRWWNVAMRRDEFTRRIFGSTNPLEIPEPPPDPPPSWWLDPAHQVVPFHPRPELAALLEWARDTGPWTKLVKLVCGPGGAGKTRLAFELATRLQSEGWIAGVRQLDDPRSLQRVAEAITAAVERGHRVFVALDYVEGLGGEIARLVSAVPTRSVRILLLARFAGAWWNSFAPGGRAKYLVDHEHTDIGPLGPDARGSQERFSSALREFRRWVPNTGPDDSVPEGLLNAASRHRDALNLHALALASALHEREHGGLPERGVDWTDPLRELVTHERKHLVGAAQSLGMSSDLPLVGQALLTPTLFAARTEDQASTTMSNIPELVGQAARANQIANRLRDLYPPAERSLRWWAPLPLDRLAETLLAQVLGEAADVSTATAYVHAILGSASIWQAAEGLTLLLRVRTSSDVEKPTVDAIDQMIDSIVSAEEFRLLGALYVAEQRVLGESPKSAAFVRGLDAAAAGTLAQKMRASGRRSLLEFALVLFEHGARIIRDQEPDDSFSGRAATIFREITAELGLGRLDMSVASLMFDSSSAEILVELGRSAEAPPLAERTVQHLRHIVGHRDGLDVDESVAVVRVSPGAQVITMSDRASDQSEMLARALHVYAQALEGQSRDAEGLACRKEAIAVARRAMLFDPNGYKLLAQYQWEHFERLVTCGQNEEAEQVLGQVISVAHEHGDDHLVALLLVEQADLFDRTDRHDDAATSLAEARRRRPGIDLPEDDPEVEIPRAVWVLRRRAVDLANRGRIEEARAAIQAAIDHVRQLEADDPETHAEQLATLLCWLAATGKDPDPIARTGEAAEVMRRRPGPKGPHQLDVFGLALLGHAGYLQHEETRLAEFVEVGLEAVHVFELLARDDPANGVPKLGTVLGFVSDGTLRLGRPRDAVVAAERAIEMEARRTDNVTNAAANLIRYRHQLCRALLALAVDEQLNGRSEAEIATMLRAAAEGKRLARTELSHAAVRETSGLLVLAANQLMSAGEHEPALEALADAIDLAESRPDAQRILLIACYAKAYALAESNQHPAAILATRSLLEVCRRADVDRDWDVWPQAVTWPFKIAKLALARMYSQETLELLIVTLNVFRTAPDVPDRDEGIALCLRVIMEFIGDEMVPESLTEDLSAELAETVTDQSTNAGTLKPLHAGLIFAIALRFARPHRAPLVVQVAQAIQTWDPAVRENYWIMYATTRCAHGEMLAKAGHHEASIPVLEEVVGILRRRVPCPTDLMAEAVGPLIVSYAMAGRHATAQALVLGLDADQQAAVIEFGKRYGEVPAPPTPEPADPRAASVLDELYRGRRTAIERNDPGEVHRVGANLVALLRRVGRAFEALPHAEDQVVWAEKAGLGAWTALSDTAVVLRIRAELGIDPQLVLADVEQAVACVSAPPNAPPGDSIREQLYHAGVMAALRIPEWREALRWGQLLVDSLRDRRAPEIETAAAEANTVRPLIELGQEDVATDVLTRCSTIFERSGEHLMLGHALRTMADLAHRSDPSRTVELNARTLGAFYGTADTGSIMDSHRRFAAALTKQDPESPHALAHLLASDVLADALGRPMDLDHLANMLISKLGVHELHIVAQIGAHVDLVPGVRFGELIGRLAPDGRGQEQLNGLLRAMMEPRREAFAELARHRVRWDPAVAALVEARHGRVARSAVRSFLDLFSDSPDWRGLAAGFLLVLEGREFEAETCAADDIDRLLLRRCVSVLHGKIRVDRHLAVALPLSGILVDILVAMQHGAGPSAVQVQLSLLEQSHDWHDLVQPLCRLLAGERDPDLGNRLPPHIHAVITLLREADLPLTP